MKRTCSSIDPAGAGRPGTGREIAAADDEPARVREPASLEKLGRKAGTHRWFDAETYCCDSPAGAATDR